MSKNPKNQQKQLTLSLSVENIFLEKPHGPPPAILVLNNGRIVSQNIFFKRLSVTKEGSWSVKKGHRSILQSAAKCFVLFYEEIAIPVFLYCDTEFPQQILPKHLF